MSQTWPFNPHFKVDVGSYSFVDDIINRIEVTRPENNVSFTVLSVDDYKSKRFLDVFDALNTIDISFYYGSDTPTNVFSGTVSTVAPRLSAAGEMLEVGAWGKGWATAKTHCNTSFGKESKNPTYYTPSGILTNLLLNYINRSFGGDLTNWNLSLNMLADFDQPQITFLGGAYKPNFDLINLVCDLRNSWTAKQSPIQKSIHWFVDPDGVIRVKTIGADQTGWLGYWKGSQSASTIEVAKDMILYDFKKNIEEYANKVLLASAFRKPAYDSWLSGLWGIEGANATIDDDPDFKLVGGSSVIIHAPATPTTITAYYPSTGTPNWDFTKVGSRVNPPTLNYYAAMSNRTEVGMLQLFTTRNSAYYEKAIGGSELSANNTFEHFTIPVGPYYKFSDIKTKFEWVATGGPSWSNINGIQIYWEAGSNQHFWIDDLHFAGKIIREAYDSHEILDPPTGLGRHEYQRIILNDTALDDSIKVVGGVADDSGTAGRLTYVELLRRKQTPIVGIIQIPLAPDILPGQLIHIHAAKQADSGTCAVCGGAGTFRIAKDFRIKELKHEFGLPCKTILNLTDDLYNSHAFAAPTQWSLLMEYAGALGHAEAKNLKGSGIDIEIERLRKDYAS